MGFNTLFFLVIGSCLCLTLAQVTYEDCCLWYVKKLGSKTQKHAVRYRWQVPDGDCNIAAVIFTMRKGREFCTDPNDQWVKDLMNKIDRKGAKTTGRKSSGKHNSNRIRG
uniref:C-C motif chemokine 4 homolog n=1 Tax=Semicossyphus pulcher TaxID=241346 RepID=UPI0037E76D77